MNENNKKYFGVSSRNALIEEIKSGGFFDFSKSKNPTVSGRIIGLIDDGFVLQDFSERIDVLWSENVNVGDIIDCELFVEKREVDGGFVEVFVANSVKVLTPCVSDFFIKQSDQNFKKMIVDLSVKEKILVRSRLVKNVRSFFYEDSFLEVDTPLMVKFPSMEPHLTPFKTTLFDQVGSQTDMFLITSPEYSMKKLLVGGAEKIFQLSSSFRNKETNSSFHNPEFVLLEWYRAYCSYLDVMNDTEKLVKFLVKKETGNDFVVFDNNRVDVSLPWDRKSVKDLFKEYSGIDSSTLEDVCKLRTKVLEKGYNVNNSTLYEDLFYLVFLNEIEPNLGFEKPVFVFDYPVQMGALAKKCDGDEKYVERFEAYICGVELCNGYSELTDPFEQSARLEAERELRKKIANDDYNIDQSFISALEFGMPPSGGNALGLDRLFMIITNTLDIRDIMLFPLRDL